MNLLGIETSCDETAAAVVADGDRLLSNVISSQFDVHAAYGGVVPELASREHLRAIVPVVREALARAEIGYQDVDAIGVTYGPGLIGALLVGVTYAKGLAASLGVPLIGVNHIEGHIHSVVLERRAAGGEVEFPALALVVSGGHSHMFIVHRRDRDAYAYRLLGRTRDDAAGEAYDKVAKLLGFGYPGGPILDRLAPHGDPGGVPLPVVHMKGNPLDMSFSGLKTAIRHYVQGASLGEEIESRRALWNNGRPTFQALLDSSSQGCLDLIASFQRRAVSELLRRAVRASEEEQVESIIVAGGVAANSGLRASFESLPLPCYFPTLALATDNAAMIAAAAYPRLRRKQFDGFGLAPQPALQLA
ncbi:MAG: tRNA (adenosine(37)-N6)-threonylcarbamoyltransferase complex transferase subunit TsaD [Bryobacterales bacterium]|nr:tRNA (adenosine(37)-N6)-threonylcarbamoyltransferase complex transferase subunit TsaD [Bryobacterales bacterium]